MNRRTSIAGVATLSVLALTLASGTAAGSTPAEGSATSTIEVAHVLAGGHNLRAADISLLSDTTSGVISSVVVTPITADGTEYGKQTITPANSPVTVPSVTSPAALASFASLTSPAVSVGATTAPAAHAGTTTLGSISLLGLSVPLHGKVSIGSSVGSTAGAVASKTVTITGLSLPSIADILGALGLDLNALPVSTLTDLLDQLNLITPAITAAQAAVDAAQSAVDAAVADLAAKTATLSTAQDTLTTATNTFNTLLGDASYTDPLCSLVGASPTCLIDSYLALSALLKAPYITLVPGLVPAEANYLSAQTAVATAQAAVAAAQTVLDTAQGVLTTATNTLQSLSVGALDTTPFVSLDSLTVSTQALAKSASTGGQVAKIVGGNVTGLHVLGTDVLNTALGSSSVDLSDLAGAAATEVNTAISTLTNTFSSVLSTVPSLPQLQVPAPTIGLLTKSTSTSISGGFGRASATVSGLSIAIPAITMPTSVALPGAASLPAMGGVTQVAGLLSTAPVTIVVVSLSDQAAFAPATTSTTSGTPTTDNTLPNTGMPIGLAAVALLFVAAGLVVRRRLELAPID